MGITATGLDPDYEKVISKIHNGIYFTIAVAISHDSGWILKVQGKYSPQCNKLRINNCGGPLPYALLTGSLGFSA